MKFRRAAFAVLALALTGGSAYAHDFIDPHGFIIGAGFLNGLLHPLLVPVHALCLLAFGLMTGQQITWHRTVLTTLFPAALIAGIVTIMFATFSVDAVPAILLACGAAAGLLTALARPLPVIVPAAILTAGGLSLIVDSVPAVVSKTDTILALLGTTLGAALVVGLVAWGVAHFTRDWQRIGVRIVGSWTAASALLVLALQLVER